MRYFRSEPNVYVSICVQLDEAYGYPNAETKTARTLPLVSELPKDQSGRVYLAIASDYCEYNLPSQILPQLIAAGSVAEISKGEYDAILQDNAPPQ